MAKNQRTYLSLTNGLRAIIDELVSTFAVTRNTALEFMCPRDANLHERAIKQIAVRSGTFDAQNPSVEANEEFWNDLGFTATYVADQIDLNM